MQTNRLLNQKYVVNGDTSAASFTGPWIRADGMSSIGFAVTVAGTPTGTFSAEGTDVDDPGVVAPTAAQIVQIPSPAGFAALQPAGAAVSTLFDYNPAPTIRWLRFKYVRSAGGAANAAQIQSLARGI